LNIIVAYDNRYVIFFDTKKYMLLGHNVAALKSAPAFTYLISAVVMCQLSNSGPLERPF
jgi:hypothetical protein